MHAGDEQKEHKRASRSGGLPAICRPRRFHPRGHRPHLGGPFDQLHPRELRAGLDRPRRVRHVDDPRRGHRGNAHAHLGDAGPHGSGRGRHLGGPRRRRVPQLPPRPLRSPPDVGVQPDDRELPLPSRPDGRGVGRARLPRRRPDPRRRPRRTGSRAGIPRLHRVVDRERRRPTRSRRATPAPGPTSTARRSRRCSR